ncbi:MAG: hypothetical protein Q9217_005148 [Psora testacea]
MSMITASVWVPRGVAAAFPTKYDVDERELERISNLTKLQLNDAKDDLEGFKRGAHTKEAENEDSDMEGDRVRLSQSQTDADDDLKEYDLEHYDSDEEAKEGETMPMFGNAQSLAYHESNADDPYITMQENREGDDGEREELQILTTDNLVVAAKVEDEVPYLEVYVYEDEADNLYVHHDIMLPAIPLCVEWLDLPVGQNLGTIDKDSRGNYVAVGTMEPDIELWDLDTIDSMYPNAILGQGAHDDPLDPAQELKKKKRKKSKKVNDEYHVDAVLALAASRQHRNLLASSSADKTIKLWDLNTTKCAKSYSHHTDKVCSIAWHPKETTVLLSGSYDQTVVVADMRTPDVKAPTWVVESDVETVMWDPHDSNYFYVTTENGVLHMNDIRNAPAVPDAAKAVWMLQAHDQSISSIDVNRVIPGFLATGSSDKDVKLWNVQPTGPSMVVSRNVGVGKVFSTQFAPDPEVAFRLAVAGSKGALQVWDTSTNAGVRRAFASQTSKANGDSNKERIIGVQEDSSDDEEEGGPEPGGLDGPSENGWESMDDDGT